MTTGMKHLAAYQANLTELLQTQFHAFSRSTNLVADIIALTVFCRIVVQQICLIRSQVFHSCCHDVFIQFGMFSL